MVSFQTRCVKPGLTPRQTGIVLAEACPDVHIEAQQLGLDALEFAESKAANLSDTELAQLISETKTKYPKAFEC